MILNYDEFVELMESASAMPVKILATSQRGAHLVSDGTHVCWVMGRMVRPDGTLTPSGMEAMKSATKTVEEWEKEDAARKLDREERLKKEKEERDARFEASKKPVEVWIPAENFNGETEKAFKVWTGKHDFMYGRRVKKYDWIPKSQATVLTKDSERVVFRMPEWLRKQYGFPLV